MVEGDSRIRMCSTGPETTLFPMPAPATAKNSCDVVRLSGLRTPFFLFRSLYQCEGKTKSAPQPSLENAPTQAPPSGSGRTHVKALFPACSPANCNETQAPIPTSGMTVPLSGELRSACGVR